MFLSDDLGQVVMTSAVASRLTHRTAEKDVLGVGLLFPFTGAPGQEQTLDTTLRPTAYKTVLIRAERRGKGRSARSHERYLKKNTCK